MPRPTIVVGLHGEADDAEVEKLARAGAGEFFVGYVPEAWWHRFGFEFSPNRRYRSFSQVGSPDRLKALCRLSADLGVPVILALNEHLTTPNAWELEQQLLAEALEAGVSGVIVADPSTIGPLRQLGIQRIHASGDMGVYNTAFAAALADLGVTRLIFPRELGLRDIAGIGGGLATRGVETEVFVMGEPCVFDGARCFTEHGYGFCKDFCNDHERKDVSSRAGGTARSMRGPRFEAIVRDPSVIALGKCGLCSIPALVAAGITHFKVPGRSSTALRSVELVREAIELVEAGATDLSLLLREPRLCASRLFCYHPEVRDERV